jgi:hypothetical protein
MAGLAPAISFLKRDRRDEPLRMDVDNERTC